MENNPLVSIIIPVYNIRPFLAEALDSVIHQTYTNLEIIVIDDGSTDGSAALCDQYAQRDNRFVVLHQENKGPGGARNAGLNSARGKLIAFLDSDDAYDASFVESMVTAMIQEDVNIVVCRHSLHKTTSVMGLENCMQTGPAIRPGKYDRDAVIRALFDGTLNFGVWNKLYAREIWETERFLEGHVFEDVDITYRIYARNQRIFVLDKVLYMYRKRPGSITTGSLSVKKIEDRMLSQSRSETFIRDHTPEVFSVEQLETYQQKRRDKLVRFYLMLSHFSKDERKEAEKNFGRKSSRQRRKQSHKRIARKHFSSWFVFAPACWALS
ncbi:MAG: glycosyltransferase family 2 protein [Clostridia bacterium]|nr:glycosyltransferase family 2 protein [Clostridia bacterium]